MFINHVVNKKTFQKKEWEAILKSYKQKTQPLLPLLLNFKIYNTLIIIIKNNYASNLCSRKFKQSVAW